MAKQLRSKKSTISNQIETFATVQSVLQPTRAINDAELIEFNRIVSSREVSTWSEFDLSIATDLAQNKVRLTLLGKQVDEEGFTLVNERGTQIANPAMNMMMQLTSVIRGLSNQLGLAASQRGLAGSAQSGRNAADREAKKIVDKLAKEDLLA